VTDVSVSRPGLVTAASILTVVAGAAWLLVGVALVVERGNDLVQIPLLLARVDEALPFDNGQDLGAYVAVIGIVVALSGVVLALLGLGVARGRAFAYVVALVVTAALTVAALMLRSRTTDDLATMAITVLIVGFAVLTLVLLALLVGARSRSWVLGRAQPV